MITQIQKLLSCPFVVLSGIAAISALSLASALTAEVALGLEPCILCLYQRIPFLLALLVSLAGLVLCKIKKEKKAGIAITLIGLCGALFLTNSAIALYHSGVELHWWKSAVEGCAVPNFGDEPQSILENILSAPTARCDEIPWADPIFDLSMANYNVLLCFGLFVVCLISVFKIKSR
ncbi:MAG: disulfide bond formation protein DsbB [Micavibrio sp.]|nr:MAG: disulfide bond formation protein DsbB [Micavibrio sp.]